MHDYGKSSVISSHNNPALDEAAYEDAFREVPSKIIKNQIGPQSAAQPRPPKVPFKTKIASVASGALSVASGAASYVANTADDFVDIFRTDNHKYAGYQNMPH